jgi:5-methylthioadenosine/S-adenosylhomocysteine deaminase
LLLCGDWVLPITGPPISDGGIVVADGAIVAVGTTEDLKRRYPGEESEEFPGCLLLPGLVNAHTHLEYSALRGFAPACGFGEWILRLLVARRRLAAGDYAASALWGAHECVRGGVTCIADTSHGGWTVARAARAAGLRGRVYLEVFGLDDSKLPETIRRLDKGLERLRAECAQAGRGDDAGTGAIAGDFQTTVESHCSDGLLEWGISPHAPYTVSARLYREAARLAKRSRLRLATHGAESRAEVDLLMNGRGAIASAYKTARLWSGRRWRPPRESPVQYVAHTGALGPETLVVHAVQVDGRDIATLAASQVAVAHCPRSNLHLECGMAPVAELMAAGVVVGLGSDGLCSNDDLDLFAEMRAALQVSRRRVSDGAASVSLDPDTVLRMATIDGARALGIEHLIGSLERGKRADIIAVRVASGAVKTGAGEGPRTDPVPHAPISAAYIIDRLIEDAAAADVLMTMVDGTVVHRGGSPPAEVVRGLDAVRATLGLGGS